MALLAFISLGFNSSLEASDNTYPLPDEICDNGIDDDGDGLFDAYDPDCICVPATEPLAYISNGDFEIIDQCCSEMSDPNSTCLENWFLVTHSPDYYSAACSSTNMTLLDLEGVPYTGGFIGTGASNDGDGNAQTESLGKCLDAPLKACRSYTFTFNALILSVLDFPSSQPDLFYTIYGLPTCPSPQDFDPTESFCNNPLSDQAQEIISFNALDLERDTWVRFVDAFSPDFDINSIVIYVTCNQQTVVVNAGFLFFDNFEFLIGPVECTISGQIETNTDNCANDYLLTANAMNGEQYQWFKDSIPLIGEESMTFIPDPTNVDGSYSVLVSNNVECAFLAPITLSSGNAITTQIVDTICMGQEYMYDGNIITEGGIYTRSLGQATNGCDLVESLDLYVFPHINAVFDFSPGLTIPIGSTLTISPETSFLSQIDSYEWAEDGLPLNTQTPEIVRTSSQPGFVSYSLSYNHSGRCAQTASFSVEWIVIGPTDEDCNNNLDDDLDGLIDTFDDDCPCTADKISNINIEESICFGDTLLFGSQELTVAGTYQDTFVNVINCDSIVTLTLSVIEEQTDTLFVTIIDGATYNFYGEILDETGWYTNIDDSNDSDCDSIHRLYLAINIPLEIYIPNAIRLGSTNGNDKFYISANKSLTITDLSIYNRWGNLIHQTDRMELVGDDPYIWDGTLNQRKVAQGLYIYTLSYSDGETTEQVTGDIMVMD